MPVQLPLEKGRPSATATLFAVLAAAVRRFPAVFGALPPDDLAGHQSPRLATRMLMRFEVLRAQSLVSADIARFVTDWIQASFIDDSQPAGGSLEQMMAGRDSPSSSYEVSTTGPGVVAEEPNYSVEELSTRLRELDERQYLSKEALLALQWAGGRAAGAELPVDLRGQRFVLLGGTAELAPLALLLNAGADVLTTNTSPDSLWRAASVDTVTSRPGSKGRLFAIEGGVDLLVAPAAFVGSALEFARERPVHVAALAYRGGQAREWRLTAAMDGVIRSLSRAGAVSSVTYYLSPSVPTEVSPDTAGVSLRRLAKDRSWRTEITRSISRNALYQPNILEAGGRFWSRSFVARQGVSYQAGNLFGKNYAAESWHAAGLRVSANVAPITRTRSTEIPRAKVAFSEIERLGVRAFEPWLTRRLMFLMMMHDLFGSDPGPAGVPFPQQVHGGVFTNPWSLNSVLQLAYLKARAKGH